MTGPIPVRAKLCVATDTSCRQLSKQKHSCFPTRPITARYPKMTSQETITTLSTAFRQLSDALHSASVACKDLEYIIPQLATSQTSSTASPSGTAQPPAQPTSQEKGKRVRDPNEPRRPPSAYLLFTSKARGDVVKNNPDLKATEVFTKLAGLWSELTDSEKKVPSTPPLAMIRADYSRMNKKQND
jgi:hypothetical protein